ncbi:cytochrome c oxidase, subunit VA/VI [Entophlyctis helioformis]|nr:cytochrome c oxidase, subunit VA/VI [Entophlyctis helioformis]
MRSVLRLVPSRAALRPAALAVSRPAFALQHQAPSAVLSFRRTYASHELDPANKGEYDAYVDHWLAHFKTVEDEFELERGLNHIFAADWVPAVEVLAEAIKASRRLNTFATAVRVLEGLEEKAYKKEQYASYIRELKPLLEELGVPEKKDLGAFVVVRERDPWTE